MLDSGERVVVKVRRPGIDTVVAWDLDIVDRLARRLQRSTRWGRGVGAVDLSNGFAAALTEELDLRIEAQNMTAVAAAASTRGVAASVRIPKPHEPLCTSNVLVMERLEGRPLGAITADEQIGDRQALARTLFDTLLGEVMIDGIFHADPHPGNVLLLANGQLALLDFGSVGRIDAGLRAAVASRGALLSEIAPGGASARWWFSVRNRVLAALAHVVVVVECHHRGGSLHTVEAALARGVTVGAVPGSVRSPASAGTNRLLVDGAVPVRGADDVLSALELAIVADPTVVPPRSRGATRRPRANTPRRDLDASARRVLRSLDHDPATLEVVVTRCGLSIGETSLALEALAEVGLAVGVLGWWSRPR